MEGDIGRCVVALVIEEEHTNLGGTLHGGLSALLLDNISTLALTTPDQGNLLRSFVNWWGAAQSVVQRTYALSLYGSN